MRVTPSASLDDIKKMIDGWCADEGLEWELAPWTKPLMAHFTTDLDGSKWWTLFEQAVKDSGITLEREVFLQVQTAVFCERRVYQHLDFLPFAARRFSFMSTMKASRKVLSSEE